ncbi:MAG TPA: hypothetical protein VFV32_14415 [Acidimicrobiales bacterium]|nr:hypothetical protein [Acidimicrobiales bacterium]
MGRHTDFELDRRWAVDASGLMALVAGGIFLVVGAIALVDLGTGDFPSPVRAEVLGLGLTQIWAIGSIVLGLLFLGGVGGYGRSLITLAGAVAVVAGIVAISAHDRLDPTLAASTSYGWTTLVVGGVVLLGAIAVPTGDTQRRESVVERRSGAFDG